MTHADNTSPVVPQLMDVLDACVQHPSSTTQPSTGYPLLLGHQPLHLSVLGRMCGWTGMSPGCQHSLGVCTELERSLPQQWRGGWRHTGLMLPRLRGCKGCKFSSQALEQLSLTELSCPALLSPRIYPSTFEPPKQGDIPGNSGALHRCDAPT